MTDVSGGHFDGANLRLARELFGWDIDTSYGEKGFGKVMQAGAINPLEDRELSKLVWDLLCVIHSYDYYACGDIGEEQYRKDVEYFKEKWLGLGRPATVRRHIEEECSRLREELCREFGTKEE